MLFARVLCYDECHKTIGRREGQFFCWIKLIRNSRILLVCECHISLSSSLPFYHPIIHIASTNHYEIGFGSRLSTFWWRWKTNRWWSMNRFSGEIFTHRFLIVFLRKKWTERECWDDHLSPPAVIFIVCHVKLWQSNDVLELYFFCWNLLGFNYQRKRWMRRWCCAPFYFKGILFSQIKTYFLFIYSHSFKYRI